MFDPDDLKSYTLFDDKTICFLFTGKALEMATAGFLPQANRLLTELWKYPFPEKDYSWFDIIGLTLLWEAAGSQPEGIPFSLENVDALEARIRDHVAPRFLEYADPGALELQGLRKARLSPMGQGKGDFPSREQELEALRLLEAQSDEWHHSLNGRARALAAELAARQGETDRAIDIMRKFVRGWREPQTNYQFNMLACSRHLAPLLLSGVLANDLELTESHCNAYLQQAIELVHTRMSQGRSLPYVDLSWREVLQRVSTAAIALDIEEELDEYDEALRASGWLGYDGATEEEIASTETRLGVQLPDDYKDFLRVSNGFHYFPYVNPPLLPVGEIDFLRNVNDQDNFDILCEYPASMDQDDSKTFADYISRGILISEDYDDTETWLIGPPEPGGHWETWVFGAWKPGAERFPGFRFYMETQL